MEKRIELEKRGRSPDQIKEICLDNCRSPTISGLDDSFVNLEVLSMINIGLTSLKGFPTLPNLRRLELSDNRISNGLQFLKGSTKLEYLNLCGNRFKELDALQPLSELKNLEILDLFNCEVTEIDNYRDHVFSLIPNLKYLDGYDKANKEIEDEALDGKFPGDDDEEDEEENENENGEHEEGDDEEGDEEEEDGPSEDDDEADEEADDSEDEEEENEVGLSYLANEQVDEESDGNDFVPGDEEDDDLDDLDEEEADEDAQSTSKGEKRKVTEDFDDDDETAE